MTVDIVFGAQRDLHSLTNLYIVRRFSQTYTVRHWFAPDEERRRTVYERCLYSKESMTYALRPLYDSLAQSLVWAYGERILPIVIESGTLLMLGDTFDEGAWQSLVRTYTPWHCKEDDLAAPTWDALPLSGGDVFRGWSFAIAPAVAERYGPLRLDDWVVHPALLAKGDGEGGEEDLPLDQREEYADDTEETLSGHWPSGVDAWLGRNHKDR